MIRYDPSVPGPVGFGEMSNSGSAFSRGAEGAATWNFLRTAAAELSYTYTDTWDASAQRRILGVPTHRGSASLVLTPAPGLTCRADWRVEDEMLDAPPNGGDIRRPGYAVVDVYGRYRWKPGTPSFGEVALQGKVLNLLDRQYEERKGYPSPGIHFLLGLELSL
jgi:outer membrane receptor protein involved in Fe transport